MIIDIAFGIFLLTGFLTGFRQGIIHSLFSLVALFFGILVALKFSYPLSYFLYSTFALESKFLPFIAFILLFLVVVIFIKIISKVVEKLAHALFLGPINRILGGILWCLIMTILFSTLLWFLNQSNLLGQDTKQQSQTFNVLITAAPILIDFFAQLIPFFKGMFDSLEQLFNELQPNQNPGLAV